MFGQLASVVSTSLQNNDVVYPETIRPDDLHDSYQASRLRLLLVPGHDEESPGAAFGSVREVDINLLMARFLFERFSADEYFIATTTKDLTTGAYQPAFTFTPVDVARITSWRDTLHSLFLLHKQNGLFTHENLVQHNNAGARVSTLLYGINEWANNNNIDVVLHIHFNDYASRKITRVGKYSGFAVYVPDTMLPNARASRALADSVYARLSSRFPSSDLPKEDIGIIPDHELIAVGANASRRKVSLLVEYGYIYEKQFKTEAVRDAVLRELAYQTYLGVKDFFEVSTIPRDDATTFLPHHFETELKRGIEGSLDVLSLQSALLRDGLYPPKGKTLSDCPLNGIFGACVESAVRSYQKKEGLSVVGRVGPQTLEKLNQEFDG